MECLMESSETKMQAQADALANYEIYGFSGKIGSGKDYVAKEIFAKLMKASDHSDTKSLFLAFADPLKMVCAARHNLTYEDVYVTKTSETRKRLQQTGDELRAKHSEMYFVNAMALEVEKHYRKSGITRFYIPDVRFPEEVKWIRKMGGKILRIDAPKRSSQHLLNECKGNKNIAKRRSEHRSETLLDNIEFDVVISNEEGDDPVQKCFDWILKFRPPVYREVGSHRVT
jgi:phosphomevalonate kinase